MNFEVKSDVMHCVTVIALYSIQLFNVSNKKFSTLIRFKLYKIIYMKHFIYMKLIIIFVYVLTLHFKNGGSFYLI